MNRDLIQPLTILRIGAEGGGATIEGICLSGVWRFRMRKSDWTPALEDEEAINVEGEWVSSLSEALALLRWPWHCLYPLEVHPQFAAQIWRLKQAKDAAEGVAYRVDTWKRVCFGKEP